MPNYVTSAPFVKFIWDTVNITYPSDTTEVYTFVQSGDTVGIITLTYTDNTKSNLLSVVKS